MIIFKKIKVVHLLSILLVTCVVAILGLVVYMNILLNKQTSPPANIQNNPYIIEAKEPAPNPPATLRSCRNRKIFTDLETALEDPLTVCHLALNGKNLTLLSPDITKLANLTELYLNNNHFTTIPPEIYQLKYLTRLDMTGNNISIIPPGINNLSYLQILNLSDNNLTEIPDEITKLPTLTSILISGNSIKSLPSNMAGMRFLNLITLPRTDFLNNNLKGFIETKLPHTTVRFY